MNNSEIVDSKNYQKTEALMSSIHQISRSSIWRSVVVKKLSNHQEALVEVNIFRLFFENIKNLFIKNVNKKMYKADLSDAQRILSNLLKNNKYLKITPKLKKVTQVFLFRIHPSPEKVKNVYDFLFLKSSSNILSHSIPLDSLLLNSKFTEVIDHTDAFASYMLTPVNPAIDPVKLTGVSIRPSNLFFQALGLETTMPGEALFAFKDSPEEIRKKINSKDPNEVVEFSANHVAGKTYKRLLNDKLVFRENVNDLSEIYGSNTYKMSYGEVQDMLKSQKIYTSSLLPMEFYKKFKESLLKDALSVSDCTLPGEDQFPVTFSSLDPSYVHLSNLYEAVKNNPENYGFLSKEEFEEFSEQTLYQIGSMVVKTEDYRIFANGKGQILERNVGNKDAIRLINACGIRGVGSDGTPQKFNQKIMRETFKTALDAAKNGITLFPAVGMGVWGGNPDLYWPAFFQAIIASESQLEAICVNPCHRGVWKDKTHMTMPGEKGLDGNEFQTYLDQYKSIYANKPEFLSKLNKIVNLYDKKTDLLQLANNLKNAFPDKTISIFNASDPDVTLGYHVTEYMNNLVHADTTEENYGALGSSGLLFETITGVHEDPSCLIET